MVASPAPLKILEAAAIKVLRHAVTLILARTHRLYGPQALLGRQQWAQTCGLEARIAQAAAIAAAALELICNHDALWERLSPH